MPTNSLEIITGITIREGTKWLGMPYNINPRVPDNLPQGQKNCASVVLWFNYRDMSRAVPLELHAFKTSYDREWDCVNGWRIKV